MWKHLLDIYAESRMNPPGKPECLFAETRIFNEGWLLRSVLQEWKTSSRRSEFEFFQFPQNAMVYSEGQLRTPFKVRPKSERTGKPKGETNTRVDGIAGNFSIEDGTKSAIKLDHDCKYVAVFEAKLYSPLSQGVTNADDYDQVSRTTACLIHALLWPEPRQNCKAYVVVLYPRDNLKIKRRDFEKLDIEARIADRLAEYENAGDSTEELEQFEAKWRGMLDQVEIIFETWEEVLAEIGDESLWEFYGHCEEFNGKHIRSQQAQRKE